MTLLVAYDELRAAIARASKVADVLDIHDRIQHIKLHARQIKDRALLADAIEFQMRAERQLGVLLALAKDAGQIAEGRRSKAEMASDSPRVTLEEVGVDRQLSSRSQRAAALPEETFETAIATSRDKCRAGQALIVDPVQDVIKTTAINSRRSDHATRTMTGGKVDDLHQLAASGFKAGFIGMDPQWHFKVRSDAGEGRSAGVHYKTEEIEKIKNIPVGAIGAEDSCLGMWTVDWCLEAAFALMRHYGYEPVTKLYTWAKTNGDGELLAHDDSTWHMGMGYWSRANPEDCWLATRGNPKRLYADVRQLIVAPLMEHSRKPDEWLARSERLVDGPYIELNARRPRQGWLSWGDELEWTGEAA